jgi:hypothetical protein
MTKAEQERLLALLEKAIEIIAQLAGGDSLSAIGFDMPREEEEEE